jgi:hypothetical protein
MLKQKSLVLRTDGFLKLIQDLLKYPRVLRIHPSMHLYVVLRDSKVSKEGETPHVLTSHIERGGDCIPGHEDTAFSHWIRYERKTIGHNSADK